MDIWSHGYNVALGYTYGFYKETTPGWLDFALRLADCTPPTGQRFRYLELGCGQGFGLNLLAALHPQAEFVGVDFNPLHIVHARSLAEAAGLKNVRFEEADFLELAQNWPVDYGQFDYAVLHGILSWVSADLRRALTDCLRHALTPGGVVYASYNSQPGWMAGLPLQHLLNRLQEVRSLAPEITIEQGAAFMNQLKEADTLLFKTLPQLASRMKMLETHDKAYLVQEYLHDNWQCFWFSEVVAGLKSVKLVFAGTATLADRYLATMLPEAQRNLITAEKDQTFQQELLDVCVNQSFRRDLFQRGLHRPWPLSHQEELLKIRLVLLARPANDAFTFKTVLGEVGGKTELYAPLMDALAKGPKCIGDLRQLPPFADKPLYSVLQSVSMLLHADMIALATAHGDIKTAVRFNRTVARVVAAGGPYQHLAGANIGTGIVANSAELLLLDSIAGGCPLQSGKLAEELLKRLQALGKTLQKDGAPLTDPAAVTAEAEHLTTRFLTVTLPNWKRLGVWA